MIINTSVPYNSKILENNLDTLITAYPFMKLETIGTSVLKKPLYSIILGNGPNKILYFSSIHANEWIMSMVLMKFLEDLCSSYQSASLLYGYNAKEIFNNSTLFIIPMVNPDGVDLVTQHLYYPSPSYITAQLISKSYPSIPFPIGWKANINGVDLNLQFPAGWKNAQQIKYSQGFKSPAPRDFVGTAPLTEPESIAIYNYSLFHNFDLAIAFHTQGKEIYWQFKNYAPKLSYDIGTAFSNVSGYSLSEVPYLSSFAGYKDWFLQNYQKPAYTIEAGFGENPLPLSQFNEIYLNTVQILLLGASINSFK